MCWVIKINVASSHPSICYLLITDTIKRIGLASLCFFFLILYSCTFSSLHLRRVAGNIICLANKSHSFNSQRYINRTYLGNVTHDYDLFFAYISCWTPPIFLNLMNHIFKIWTIFLTNRGINIEYQRNIHVPYAISFRNTNQQIESIIEKIRFTYYQQKKALL